MSVKSIYRRMQESLILDENGVFSELFQGSASQNAKAMNYTLKLAMNDRDARIISFLVSSSKIELLFAQAIKHKDERMIDFLLSRGVGLGPWSSGTTTAIHQAYYCDYMSIVDVLFAHSDNNYNFTDVNGLSYFHVACAAGNLPIARHFIMNLAVDPELCFRYELSPDKLNDNVSALHLAVEYARVEIVELLLSVGVMVNVKDHFGLTPLHLACFRLDKRRDDYGQRQLDTIELLLRNGGDVNARDCFGNTPLLSVFQDNHTKPNNSADINVDMVSYYQYDCRDESALQKRKVELLLKYHADATIANDKGDNALHLLIDTMENLRRPKALAKVSFHDEMHVEIANLLLNAGAKVNARNGEWQTPLQLAVRMLSLDMVEILLKYDANVGGIRFDEFCYSEDVIPSLEATENLLGIVEKLSSNGLILDKQTNLAVLKFLIGNHVNCRYDVWTDRNASYKLKNLLEFGTDENIITAFAKFPLDMYDTSFKSQSMKKQMVQQIYEHVTILEKGGFYMSNKVHKSLNSKISSLEKCILKVLGPNKKLSDVDLLEFENEFQAMRATSLSSSTSLHDMLTMNPRKSYYYIKNFANKKTCLNYSEEDGKIGYSRSDGIMKGHFAKSLVRKYASKSATEYFRSLINFPLPELCCDKIFDYLDNDNLLNLCVASTGLDFQKRKKFKNQDFHLLTN